MIIRTKQPLKADWGCFCLTVAAVLGAAAWNDAWAQSAGGSEVRAGLSPVTIRLDQIHRMRVTTSGGAEHWIEPINADPGQGVTAGGNCPGTNVASHTNANFSGGEFVVQAGFAEGEITGAQYVLSPNDFPISINQLEFIIAQQAAAVPTTTKWSVFVWDGPPGGPEVLSISSDNKLFPDILLPPGTQGVNVQIVIDPSDPIFVENVSGTNSFSIGFRIDEHNNQTQNPCFVAPPSNQNAFPTTDTGGLQTQTGNWANYLPCPFGCGAGWKTFLEQPGNPGQLCTPSGDWVMRATYTCTGQSEIGACCQLNGNCLDNIDEGSCASLGEFQGGGTTCANVNCPQPVFGACCQSNGTCSDFTEMNDCIDDGGTFKGEATLCSGVSCPGPDGACCKNGVCLAPSTQAQCAAITGIYLGNGATCVANACSNGACCHPDGTCTDLIGSQCSAAGGTFQGVGTACATFNCPEPVGACCIDGICFDGQPPSICDLLGQWKGPQTICDAHTCFDGACAGGEGDCCETHPTSGCGDPDCCVGVCNLDPFCCDFEWDSACVELTEFVPECNCQAVCPAAIVLSASPPIGTVDARQHMTIDGSLLQGIGGPGEPITVLTGTPASDNPDCWTLCDTSSDGVDDNAIASVTTVGANLYSITLDRPISPNAVTRIRYNGAAGAGVLYISHPANANGDSAASASDVLFVVDMLNNVAQPPHGTYSQDIDHSAAFGPADILRVIDLLNGSGAYTPQNGTSLPSAAACP